MQEQQLDDSVAVEPHGIMQGTVPFLEPRLTLSVTRWGSRMRDRARGAGLVTLPQGSRGQDHTHGGAQPGVFGTHSVSSVDVWAQGQKVLHDFHLPCADCHMQRGAQQLDEKETPG